MADAPFMSTFIAIALIPVAVLFTHAYLSGKRKLPYHKVTGTTGIIWDLSASFFYMIIRSPGAAAALSGAWIAYFAIHGIIAVVVIAIEFVVLATGIQQWRTGKKSKLHKRLTPILYVSWFAAFISGEIVYIILYML